MFHVAPFLSVTVVSLALSVRIAPVSSEWSAVAVTAEAVARLWVVLSRTPFRPIGGRIDEGEIGRAAPWTANASAEELHGRAGHREVGHAPLEEKPEASDAQGSDAAAVEAD